MLLDDTYGLLNLLELFFNCFDSLYQVEYEFQNSMLAGNRAKEFFQRFYKNLRTLVTSNKEIKFLKEPLLMAKSMI